MSIPENDPDIEQAWAAYVADPKSSNFTTYYDVTAQHVMKICRGILRDEDDALDAFQSAYARMLNMVEGSDSLPEEGSIAAVTARNAAREADILRKRRNRRRSKEVVIAEIPEGSASTESNQARDMDLETMRQVLDRLISELPERYRVALTLHYMEGLTLREISEALDLSINTVASRVRRGAKQLEKPARRAGLRDVMAALTTIGGMTTLTTVPASATTYAAALQLMSALGAVKTGIVAGALASPKFLLGGVVLAGVIAALVLKPDPPVAVGIASPGAVSSVVIPTAAPAPQSNQIAAVAPVTNAPAQAPVNPPESTATEATSQLPEGLEAYAIMHRAGPPNAGEHTVWGIVQTEDGDPVSDATVTISRINWIIDVRDAPNVIKSDSEGRFAFSNIKQDEFNAPGQVPAHSYPLVLAAVTESPDTGLNQMARTEYDIQVAPLVQGPIILRFQETASAEITVLSEETGELIADAVCHGHIEFPTNRTEVSPGVWRFDGIFENSIQLSANAPGHVRSGAHLQLFLGRTNRLEIRLERGGSVRGKVNWSRGTPRIAHVRTMAVEGQDLQLPGTMTDQDGNFELDGIPLDIGMVTLEFTGVNFEPQVIKVELSHAKPTEFVEVQLQDRVNDFAGYSTMHPTDTESGYDSAIGLPYGAAAIPNPPTAEISGRLVDRWGQPVVAGKVGLKAEDTAPLRYDHIAYLDDEGMFLVEGITPGKYLLYCINGAGPRGFHYCQAMYPVDLSEEGAPPFRDYVAPVPGLVYGRVLDEETEKPLTRFQLRTGFSIQYPTDEFKPTQYHISNWTGMTPGTWFDSPRGVFRIDDVVDRMNLQVVVRSEGYPTQVFDSVRGSREGDAQPTLLKMNREAIQVSGVVLDDRGQHLPGARLRLVALLPETEYIGIRWSGIDLSDRRVMDIYETEADAEGRFEFTEVPPTAKLVLRADAEGRAPRIIERLEKVGLEKLKDLRLRTEPGAEIKGVVDGTLLSELYEVELWREFNVDENFRPLRHVLPDDGSFAFRGLEKGRYRVQFLSPPQRRGKPNPSREIPQYTRWVDAKPRRVHEIFLSETAY